MRLEAVYLCSLVAGATHRGANGFGIVSNGCTFSQSSKAAILRSSKLYSTPLAQEEVQSLVGTPTELPDSLDDSAELAAKACIDFSFTVFNNVNTRCRVDFDTSMGDETYTALKSSTEFMQKFTTALCYGMIDGLMTYKQDQMMKVVQARAELQSLTSDKGEQMTTESAEEAEVTEKSDEAKSKKIEELKQIVISDGLTEPWNGDKVRVYFPDEGNAALARRDWRLHGPDALIPACVEFSSLGGIQTADTSKDVVVIYFCPRAAECEYLEETLYKYEESGNLKMSILVNPLLVDMGVTGFGMVARRLRERLLDGLQNTYYLRTLQWGALTRSWPRDFTVWQDDEAEDGGYRMIKQLERLPSNPEVEDIYDIENGDKNAPAQGPGFLNALGDFVQGMTRL